MLLQATINFVSSFLCVTQFSVFVLNVFIHFSWLLHFLFLSISTVLKILTLKIINFHRSSPLSLHVMLYMLEVHRKLSIIVACSTKIVKVIAQQRKAERPLFNFFSLKCESTLKSFIYIFILRHTWVKGWWS